jgi:HAD superfamily hydrolase (TIGR01490 family)
VSTLRRPRAAAFFDIDETVVAFKSMFRFLAYYLADRGEPPGTYERVAGALRSAAARLPRHEVNRRYHRVFAGERPAALAAVGRAWFEAELRAGEVFIPAVLAELRAHKAAGTRVVLVSGQFCPCLDPSAAAAGADRAVGTEPVIVDGRLTGEVRRPNIGAAKAEAVRAEAAGSALRLADCHAYGDHPSDVPMLQEVGHPVVVGDDPALTRHATAHGWRVIPIRGDRSGPALPGDL